MKKLVKWLSVFCTALLLEAACQMPLESQPGSESGHIPESPGRVEVTITLKDSAGRSVLPDTSGSVSYALWGALVGAEAGELTTFTNDGTTITIDSGTWNFTLKAFNTEGEQILQGELAEQVVGAGSPNNNNLEFSLSPLPIDAGGTGSVSITIRFPPIPVITKADVYIGDELLETVEATENSIVYTDSEKAAGNYLIGFDLKDASDTVVARISELVLVRKNLVSAKTIDLLLEDLQNPTISLSATGTSKTRIDLTWNSIDETEQYEVYGTTDPAGTYTFLGTTEETSYFNTALATDTVYYYKIYGLNSSGQAFACSPYVSASTWKDAPDLAGPAQVSTVGYYRSITLDWDTVSEAIGYNIYRSLSFDGTYVHVGTSTSTAYLDTELLPGTTYYYEVSAYITEGEEGQLSFYSSAMTTYFPAPEGVSATAISSNRITVSWNAVTGASRYYLYYATSLDGTYTYVGETSSTNVNHSSLEAGTVYYYKVMASAGSGQDGDYSTTVSAITKQPISISFTVNTPQEANLSLQNLFISKGETTTFNIPESWTVYQWYLDGTLQPSATTYSYSLDTSSLSKGIHEVLAVVTDAAGEMRSGRCRITVIEE
jgi:fibronectin type 3 domain-containing protein